VLIFPNRLPAASASPRLLPADRCRAGQQANLQPSRDKQTQRRFRSPLIPMMCLRPGGRSIPTGVGGECRGATVVLTVLAFPAVPGPGAGLCVCCTGDLLGVPAPGFAGTPAPCSPPGGGVDACSGGCTRHLGGPLPDRPIVGAWIGVWYLARGVMPRNAGTVDRDPDSGDDRARRAWVSSSDATCY